MCAFITRRPKLGFRVNEWTTVWSYIAICRHTRIADKYCGGAAVTKFPAKYFSIELCVESGVRNGEGHLFA